MNSRLPDKQTSNESQGGVQETKREVELRKSGIEQGSERKMELDYALGMTEQRSEMRSELSSWRHRV